MPIFTVSWGTSTTLHAAGTLAAGASVNDSLDLATAGIYAAAIQAEVQFPSGTDANDLEILVYSSSDGGSNFDTEPLMRFSIPFVASTTKRKSFTIQGVPFARVTMKNNTALTLTSVSSKYQGLKQASA